MGYKPIHHTLLLFCIAVALWSVTEWRTIGCAIQRTNMVVDYVELGLRLSLHLAPFVITLDDSQNTELDQLLIQANTKADACSQSASFARWQGDILQQQGKWDAALARYELSASLDPLNPLTVFRMANVLYNQNQSRHAVTMLQPLRAHSAIYGQAQYQAINGMAESALQYYELSFEVDRQKELPVTFFVDWSVVASALQKPVLALNVLNHGFETVHLPRDVAQLHVALADLYSAENPPNLDNALEHLQEAVRLEPDSIAWQQRLGDAYRKVGQYRDAKQHLQAALKLAERDSPGALPEVYFTLGMLYSAACQLDEAIVAFNQVLSSENTKSGVRDTAQYLLGQTYRRQGRTQDARIALEIATGSSYEHIVQWAREEILSLDFHDSDSRGADCSAQ